MDNASFIGRSGKPLKDGYELASQAIADKIVDYIAVTGAELSAGAPRVIAFSTAAVTASDYDSFPAASLLIDGEAGKIHIVKTDGTVVAVTGA